MRKKITRQMLSRHRPMSLKRKKTETIASAPKRRDKFIANGLKHGGEQVVEAVRRFGVNEKGKPIRLTNWFEEVLLLLGDLRISEVSTTGCSQLGKTLAHTLTLCALLTEGALSVLWSYDKIESKQNQVKSNFWPVIQGEDDWDGWRQRVGIRKKPLGASQNIGLYQVAGGTAHFVHVSSRSQGSASAAGQLVGVSRDFLVREEISQYGPGEAEPLERRLDASRIEARPVRNNGTPGSGLGIEMYIEDAERHFIPHCHCPECGKINKLDPFGALLQPSIKRLANGEELEVYLSDSGRPLQWFHADKSDPIKSAYFGCIYCDAVLTGEVRTKSWYQCIKSGITIREYLDSLPPGLQKDSQSVGIEITPLLRVQTRNTAADIIKKGLTTTDTADWCQQMLGKPSTSSDSGISLELIKACIDAPTPDRPADLTVIGDDQARQEGDHCWIQKVWFPENWHQLETVEILETSIRQLVIYKAIPRNKIGTLIDLHGVEFGVIDGEPDIPSAFDLARAFGLVIADQKQMKNKRQVQETSRQSGGIEFASWDIRANDFQNAVLQNFTMKAFDGHLRMRLPESWKEKVTMKKDEKSPIRHLMGMQRPAETGIWERPSDKKDGAFFAAMFAEAAIAIWLEKKRDASTPLGDFTIDSMSEEQSKWFNDPTPL